MLLTALAFAGLARGSVTTVTIGLVLLGLGWSAATTAGSALLVEAVPPNAARHGAGPLGRPPERRGRPAVSPRGWRWAGPPLAPPMR